MNAPGPALGGRSAEVVACGRRIRYARCGAGSPVVLLLADELPARLAAELREGLVSRFRVFEPEAGTDGDLRWLPTFLEGLGLLGAGVVAAGRLGAEVKRVALEAPDLVSRVVLLADGSTHENGSPHPAVAVLRLDPAGVDLAALLRRVARFLSAEASASPA